MNDEYLDRLRANDPAADVEPDVASLRARVFAHVDDNVVMLTPRTARLRALRYAAVIALMAMAAGGGYLGGSAANVQPSTLEVPSGQTAMKGAEVGIGGNAANGTTSTFTASDGSGAATKQAGLGGWYGNTVLKPAASMPNQGGDAMAYQLTDQGLDRMALGRAIAKALGLDPSLVKEGTYGIEYTVSGDGNSNLQVGNETQANFWGNNWARNPYSCDQPIEAKPQTGTAPAPTAAASCARSWTAPSKDQAISQAKQALAGLRLPLLDNAIYTASMGDDRMANVQVTPVFAGMPLNGFGFWVQVGELGVFGMSGSAAHLEKAMTYPIDGARDVALRSQLRKWAAFGPMNVTPQIDGVYVEESPRTLVTSQRNGRLMVQGQLAEVDVNKAQAALQQQWFPGGEVLFLPAWNYSATDGSVWQMLAITADYVDWTATSGMPIAYGAMAR